MEAGGLSYSTSVLPSDSKMKRNVSGTVKSKTESVCLTYQKLVVPLKMRSVYWKGFGFPANEKGEILTRQKIVCLFCQTAIAYNRNTSNLRMHLESKHRAKLMELEANAPAPVKKSRLAEKNKAFHAVFEVDSSEPEHVYASDLGGALQMEEETSKKTAGRSSQATSEQMLMDSNPGLVEIVVPNLSAAESTMYMDEDADCIESAITEFLVTDLVSPCVVEGTGFKHLLTTLRPGIVYTSKAKVEEQLLPQCHTALRDAIIEELSGTHPIGVSLEEWISGSGHRFVTLSAHLLKDTDSMETRMLSSLQLPIDVDQWSSTILQALQCWGIEKDRVTAVVVASSQSEQLLNELRASGIKVLPCLTSTLQVAVEKCFKTDLVPNLLAKCRALEQVLQPTSLLSDTSDEDSGENLSIDYPGIWTSTFYLLQKLIQKEKIINEVYQTQDDDTLCLSLEEWDKIKIIVNILEPFTVIIDTLNEEKIPSMSLIRPFLCQMINSHLKDVDIDDDTTTILKLTLREDLINSYADEGTDLLLKMSSFLDPRFKSLPFNQDEDGELVMKNIKNSLEEAIQGNQFVDLPSVDRKPRLSGIGLLLGNLCSPKGNLSKPEKAQLEFSQYQSEPAASFDVCPLQWWSATRTKCPNLAQLARNFTCVPASTIPTHLLAANKRALFTMRRASINPEHVDKILFLHANQKLFSFQDN